MGGNSQSSYSSKIETLKTVYLPRFRNSLQNAHNDPLDTAVRRRLEKDCGDSASKIAEALNMNGVPNEHRAILLKTMEDARDIQGLLQNMPVRINLEAYKDALKFTKIAVEQTMDCIKTGLWARCWRWVGDMFNELKPCLSKIVVATVGFVLRKAITGS